MISYNPFMPPPPVYEDVVTADNKLSDTWKNHLDDITQTTGYVVAHDRFNDTKEDTAITRVVAMRAARRNQLQNATDGCIIYNLDTNAFNFRQGGAWVTFTPVPA